MSVGVRRASAFMALGLRAANESSIDSIQLDTNNHISFFPNNVGQDDILNIKSEFASWVIASGLRELDQFLAVFCDELFVALTYLNANGKVLGEKSLNSIKQFKEGTSASGKLNKIREEFGVDSHLSKHFIGFSSARNCLTHHLGFVVPRHCNVARALELTWLGQDMVVGERVISDSFEPFRVEKGESIWIRFPTRSKKFELDSKIILSSRDLSEICFTYDRHSVALVKATEDRARELGIEVKENKKK